MIAHQQLLRLRVQISLAEEVLDVEPLCLVKNQSHRDDPGHKATSVVFDGAQRFPTRIFVQVPLEITDHMLEHVGMPAGLHKRYIFPQSAGDRRGMRPCRRGRPAPVFGSGPRSPQGGGARLRQSLPLLPQTQKNAGRSIARSLRDRRDAVCICPKAAPSSDRRRKRTLHRYRSYRYCNSHPHPCQVSLMFRVFLWAALTAAQAAEHCRILD